MTRKASGRTQVSDCAGFWNPCATLCQRLVSEKVLGPRRLCSYQRPDNGAGQSEKPENVRLVPVQSECGAGRLWTNKWAARCAWRAVKPIRATLFFTLLLSLRANT